MFRPFIKLHRPEAGPAQSTPLLRGDWYGPCLARTRRGPGGLCVAARRRAGSELAKCTSPPPPTGRSMEQPAGSGLQKPSPCTMPEEASKAERGEPEKAVQAGIEQPAGRCLHKSTARDVQNAAAAMSDE
eukprot:3684402-Pleurochrysis_carterae.AAC.4